MSPVAQTAHIEPHLSPSSVAVPTVNSQEPPISKQLGLTSPKVKSTQKRLVSSGPATSV